LHLHGTTEQPCHPFFRACFVLGNAQRISAKTDADPTLSQAVQSRPEMRQEDAVSTFDKSLIEA